MLRFRHLLVIVPLGVVIAGLWSRRVTRPEPSRPLARQADETAFMPITDHVIGGVSAAAGGSVPVAVEPAALESAPPTSSGAGIVAEWSGPAPVLLRHTAEQAAAEGRDVPGRLPLRLRADREAVLLVRAFTATATGGGVFTGEIENHPGSTVVLAYEGDSVSGVALLPAEGRSFNYRAGEDGLWRVTELDTARAPGCGQPVAPFLPPQT